MLHNVVSPFVFNQQFLSTYWTLELEIWGFAFCKVPNRISPHPVVPECWWAPNFQVNSPAVTSHPGSNLCISDSDQAIC